MRYLLQVAVPPAPPAPPQTPAPVIVGPDPNFLIPQIIEAIAIGVVAIAITVAAVKIFRPLIAALARRVEGRGGESALQAEVDQLRHEVAEVDNLRARVAELEERVDFTERLLTRQASEVQLPRGGPS